LQAPQICKYILPSDGTIVNADPIALVNTSPNYEAALAFIQWQLSAEGQTVWLNENINRLPANPKVFDTPQGMARSDLKETFEVTKNTIVIPFSDDLALSYENSLIYYYHNVIVVPQVKLRNAWMQLCDAYSMNKITRVQFMNLTMKLGNPNSLEFTDPTSGTKQTFAESYAKSINSKLASDATFKEKLGSELSRAASTRYDSVITELRSITG
jgi:spermidine/putrescine-binding protein